jgi:hypothetical protein
MDSKGAFRRRMDLAFVHRGGVTLSLESISNFLAAVDVEPDTLTIQRYIKQQHAAAAENEEGKCAVSPRLPRNQPPSPLSPTSSPTSGGLRAMSVPRVSLSDCFELAHQCMEVQHRRAVGGNEAHYLQLAWVGCGGDEDRKGSIPRNALMGQLASIGVETGFDSPTEYSSDTDEPPTMTFHDLVGLVSVSKTVLDSAARCSDPTKIVLASGGMSSEELKAARAQVIALVNFKLRMRAVVAARRRRRAKERRDQEEAAGSIPRVASVRFGPGGHRGGKSGAVGGGRRASTTNGPVPQLGSMASLVTSSPQVLAASSEHGALGGAHVAAKPKSRAERILNRNMERGTNAVHPLEGMIGSSGPDVLYLDTSTSPWNLNHPFVSMKVKTDWIRRGSPPQPRRGQPSDDDGDDSPSTKSGSPGRIAASLTGETPTSLPALKNRLAQLLREQVSSHRAKVDARSADSRSRQRLSPGQYELSLVITASEAQGDASGAFHDHPHRVPSSTGSAGDRHVRFNDTLATTLLSTTNTTSPMHSKTVACQCNEADIILDLYGLHVPRQLRATLRAAQAKQSDTNEGNRSKRRKAGAARLPPLPHAGRF